jgi:membrane protein YqaA with SNARE-associated domain
MRLFSRLYEKSIQWAAHRHAPIYLAALSFAESSIFPIPPDVILAPMSLAKPEHAWRYASITTFSSVLGGFFGYFLGMFFIKLIYPFIIQFGYLQTYQQVEHWFLIWDFWIIFLAGFTPIPYKIFTIAAGAASMPLLPFLIASMIGRGGRFFLVAALIHGNSERMQWLANKYIDRIGWFLVASIFLAYGIYWLYSHSI